MKSLFSPGGRSRKPHKCYYMSRLIKYDWNLFTFRFGAAYFFILNLPKDFWTSYRIPAENIFLNIRMLIAMLLIFHHFQISIIFMNECSFKMSIFKRVTDEDDLPQRLCRSSVNRNFSDLSGRLGTCRKSPRSCDWIKRLAHWLKRKFLVRTLSSNVISNHADKNVTN